MKSSTSDKRDALCAVAHTLGSSPDVVQGAGGNLSVKLDGQKMLIKASGCRFSELREDNGFVTVDWKQIHSRYDQLPADMAVGLSEEAEDVQFVDSCILERFGEGSRASIETGFHAFLGRFALHTHSVYANLVSCAKDGEALLKSIFGGSDIRIVWVPYVNPGLPLALAVRDAVSSYRSETGIVPDVLLLQNHGVIVNADKGEKLLELHEAIQSRIQKALKIPGAYPNVEVRQREEGVFESATPFLANFVKGHLGILSHVSNYVLFPDQVVFCEQVAVGENVQKLNGKHAILVGAQDGRVMYRATEKQALTIEEVLIAWAFLMDSLERMGKTPSVIKEADQRYISGMNSEAHRRKLLK